MTPAIVPRALLAACCWLTAAFAAAAGTPTTPFNGLSRPNGKQIVRTGQQWLLVTPGTSEAPPQLMTAPLGVGSGKLDRWQATPILFDSPKQRLKSPTEAWSVPPSIVVDRHGRLHVAWDDGRRIFYSTAAEPGAAPGKRELALKAQTVLDDARFGDIAVDERGRVWIAAVGRNGDGSTTLRIGHSGQAWKFDDLATDLGYLPPVMHLAGDGSAHVAWSDTRGRVLYQHYRPGEKGQPHVLCTGGFYPNGRNPAIIALDQQVLVVYESLYNQIEYAVLENGKWRQVFRFTTLDNRLAPDVLHSPQLALDRHGVAWLFFSDSTRRFTYFARWLGSEWSDIYDCRGIYYRSPRFETDLLPTDWLAVEKYPPPQAADVGLALANSLAPEKNEFQRIAVPAPKAAAGSSTLFVDLLEVGQMQNLRLELNEARKDPHNPLLEPGKLGSFDQDRVLNHGTVLFDEGKFRMWYGAAHRQRGVFWFRWMSAGYAESPDGLHWEKPCIDGSAGPSLDCNRQPLPWPCAVFKDPHDKHPAQRYKCVQFDRHQLQAMSALAGDYDMDSPIGPGQLYQSADGLHWTHEPISIAYPDGKPAELVVQSFFIDPHEPDPARRWKIYGYASLVTKRRAGCYAYSADGRTWTAYPRNPILDPTVSEVPLAPSGPISQIHDTVVFPYCGYYLALFHAQHDANLLDVELAASRDGEHFVHVQHGHKVITLGPAGAWDARQILQTPAVAAHDKLWLFYGGQSMPAELLAKGETNNELLVGGAGLATLRLDGFTSLAVKDSESGGSLTTVPIERIGDNPLALVVNADCSPQAPITVEELDASGTVLQSARLASDHLRHIIHLLDGPPGREQKHFTLRFRFDASSSSARLYGFSFAHPVSGSR